MRSVAATFRIVYLGPADPAGRLERTVVFEHVEAAHLPGLLARMTKAADRAPLRVVIEREVETSCEAMHGKSTGAERRGNALNLCLLWCPPGVFETALTTYRLDRKQWKTITPLKIVLTRGFWIGKNPIMQSQWKQLVALNTGAGSLQQPEAALAISARESPRISESVPIPPAPWEGRAGAVDGNDYPAAHVSWEHATAFCANLTELEREMGRLPADWEFTLPTEAQWEHACRAGTNTKFCFGDDESRLRDYAWFRDNAAGVGADHMQPVGLKRPNAWGLHDVHGNVFEWCRDTYAADRPGGRDPELIDAGPSRVYRGGSYFTDAAGCASSFRLFDSPDETFLPFGFRVALCEVRGSGTAG